MPSASVSTMTRQPDPRRSPTPYAITARITTAQYVALVSLAEARDIPMSGAVRLMIDAWVEEHMTEADRRALESGMVVEVHPDPEWEQRHSARPPA